MIKIINTGRPVVMTTNRTPLDLQLSISQRGGDPLTQVQDYSAGLWSPDRTMSALALDVELTAYDPDLGSNITVSTSNFNWYVNAIQDWDSTTETGLVNTSDATANYYLEYVNSAKTGSLMVRKNVNYDDPVTLFCVIEFTDSTRAEAYHIETTVLLTTENRPDEFYYLNIVAPNVTRYHPFNGDSSQCSFVAKVFKGKTEVVAPYLGGIKFFWYYLNDSTYTLIPTDGTYAPYVSGQNTSTLVLDAAYVEHETIRLRMSTTPTYTAVESPTGNPHTKGYFERGGTSPDYYYTWTEDTAVVSGKTYYTLSNASSAPDHPEVAQVDIERVIPDIEVLPYCTGGSAVDSSDTQKGYKVIVRQNGKDMDSSLQSEYLRFNWKSKPTNSNTITDRGWGEETQISASELMTSGMVNVEVYAEPYVLSEYQLLTYNDELLTDDSGSATASNNGGYVVGRV